MRAPNCANAKGKERFHDSFPLLPVLSSPTQKLIWEQAQHIWHKGNQAGGYLAAAGLGNGVSVC